MTTPPAGAVRPAGGEDTLDKCMVRAAPEIRAHLQRLLDGRCMLVGHAEGASATQVTALLQMDATSLRVDVPRADAVLDAWLRSPKLLFEGSLERITVRFGAGPAWLDSWDGRPALGLPLPTRLLHLQRREYLRVEPPPGALQCRVPVAKAGQADSTWVEATIRDIGGGGLAVLAPSEAFAFQVGDILPGCVIDLPDGEPVSVDLRVCHVIERSVRGAASRHAGCEFVSLSRAMQDRLFRYVMQLDRERVLRRRALGP